MQKTALFIKTCLGGKINIQQEEGSVDMCKAWDDMIEEGIRNAEKEMKRHLRKDAL